MVFRSCADFSNASLPHYPTSVGGNVTTNNLEDLSTAPTSEAGTTTALVTLIIGLIACCSLIAVLYGKLRKREWENKIYLSLIVVGWLGICLCFFGTAIGYQQIADDTQTKWSSAYKSADCRVCKAEFVDLKDKKDEQTYVLWVALDSNFDEGSVSPASPANTRFVSGCLRPDCPKMNSTDTKPDEIALIDKSFAVDSEMPQCYFDKEKKTITYTIEAKVNTTPYIATGIVFLVLPFLCFGCFFLYQKKKSSSSEGGSSGSGLPLKTKACKAFFPYCFPRKQGGGFFSREDQSRFQKVNDCLA